MGKVVMPKNSALLNEIESVLKIYYEANDWISNDVYKTRLKSLIGDDQYSSSYTKKAQITSYFGFTEWADINNSQSLRRITSSGKVMYESLQKNDTEKVQEVLLEALEQVKFGRDNYGCPESNTDVEPPVLFVRAILDLGYLTYKEFAWLLWKLEDIGANYTDSIKELCKLRNKDSIQLEEEAKKYVDCKPIMILVRWGFLAEDKSENFDNGKHIIIAPDVLRKYYSRLRNLKIYNIDRDVANTFVDKSVDNDSFEKVRLTSGENVLLYGVPGSGKSWIVEHEYCKPGSIVERVVFYPDYTYSDFIGQILPEVAEDGQMSYKFVAGPFTNILREAYNNPETECILIIEEINRGNAPSIFGEIIQLLDRKDKISNDGLPIGTSEYGITNQNIAGIVYGKDRKTNKVRIPSNLSIIGTMNTSDQNVFTLDTAFQRRWDMCLIENDFDNVDKEFADAEILDTTVTWRKFCIEINNIVIGNSLRMTSTEDKRLGAYFIHPRDLKFNNEMGDLKEYDALRKKESLGMLTFEEKKKLDVIREAMRQNRKFPDKVIKYLWDDAFKFNREIIFEVSEYHSLDEIIHAFMYAAGLNRFKVFKDNIKDALIKVDDISW